MAWEGELQAFGVESFFYLEIQLLDADEVRTPIQIAPPVNHFQIERRIQHPIKGDNDIGSFGVGAEDFFENFQGASYARCSRLISEPEI